jgi:hypothetical protein
MTYEDLLLVPYKAQGRDAQGMDCYGLVVECCKRAYTPVKDFEHIASLPVSEATRYISRVNLEERSGPVKGYILQCEYEGKLHTGYMLDSKRVLHMTEKGARVSPVFALRNRKYFEVVNG